MNREDALDATIHHDASLALAAAEAPAAAPPMGEAASKIVKMV